MRKPKANQILVEHDAGFPRPCTTVDVAIFAVLHDRLQVLLIERSDAPGEPFPKSWALPGGYIDIDRDSSLEECALRKLKEKTGLASPYVEQLGSWGSKSRDPRGWSATHAYFALIPADVAGTPIIGGNSVGVRWIPVIGSGTGESLAFDHEEILAAAIERLRGKVEYTSLPAFLLPREFTLTDLQRMYEIVLQRKLEKSAFRTRVLSNDLVVSTPRFREGPNRPAQLYRLKSLSNPVFFQRTFKPAD